MAKKRKPVESARSPRREAIGVILLALCLLSFLSVFSFHWEDLSLFNNPPVSPPHNLVGPFGAWYAGIGFCLFGVGGYLMPFVLLTGGLLMTLRSYQRTWPTWSWLFCLLISLSSLFEYQSALWGGLATRLNLTSLGGIFGQLLAVRTLGAWIGHTGAGIIFVTAMILAVLQLTGMHPFTPFIFLWNRIKALINLKKDNAEKAPKPARTAKVKKPNRKEPKGELFVPPTPAPAPAPGRPGDTSL
jgi:hypothetical protein